MRVVSNFLLMTILYCAVGCGINDIQPTDTELVPVTVAETIKRRYSLAQDILLKTLISNKLWQANFTSNASEYETQVNATAIVAAVTAKGGNDFSFYKHFTDQLSIKGGEFLLCV